MIRFFKYNTLGLAAIAAVMTGCVNDSSECPLSGETGGSYVLRLSVSAGESTMSRAADHTVSAATEAEKFINVADGDYSVLLFDESGNFIAEVENPIVSYQSADLYWVESEIAKENLEGVDNFQVMVLANGKSYDSSLSLKGKVTTQTTDELWSDGANFNFSHQAYLSGGTTAWTPSIEAKRFIPMFGIQTVSKSDFETDLSGVKRATISVQMLRSLAKIEVVDNTPAGYSITGVELTSYNTSGRLIPNISSGSGNESWNQEATQVTVPSLPANVQTGSNLKFVELSNGSGKSVWTAYVAEAEFAVTTLTDARPHLNVEVTSTAGHKYSYPVHFAQYSTSGTSTIPAGRPGWHRLLRNHIYRYEVNTASVTSNLLFNVINWDTESDEIWFYEEIPGAVDPIEWDEETYQEMDETKATVKLYISEETSKILHGTFEIPSPLSGTWHAQLMTIGNALPTAIVFCDSEGNEISTPDGQTGYHIWGPVGEIPEGQDYLVPKRADIYIKVTNTGVEQESDYKLLILVQNNDNWMEVNLTPDSSDEINYWTIIRPTNDFTQGGD